MTRLELLQHRLEWVEALEEHYRRLAQRAYKRSERASGFEESDTLRRDWLAACRLSRRASSVCEKLSRRICAERARVCSLKIGLEAIQDATKYWRDEK